MDRPEFKPGWNKKRDNRFTWRQVQKLVGNVFTKEEWVQAFKDLSPKDQWELLYKYHPPPKQLDINQGVTVTLQIHGLENKAKQIEGQIVETKALEAVDS